jgi:hypothetical protein
MSISIYYRADRDTPLGADEQRAIAACIAKHPPPVIGDGSDATAHLQWEGFCVYPRTERTEPQRIFEGATKLSGGGSEDLWRRVQHWCALLTDIRRAVPDARWDVTVEDHQIIWEEKSRSYRPDLD